MGLLEHVGNRIRELRTGYAGGKGISQEALAKELRVTANTISRWETATYRPSIVDLENVSRFFGVSILELFPPEETPRNDKVTALLRAAKDLPDSDLEELRRYAEFRRASSIYKTDSTARPRRKGKQH